MPRTTHQPPEPPARATQEIVLPSSVETEKLVLGAILQGSSFSAVAEILKAEDFSLQIHQRVYSRMAEIAARGVDPDYVLVANELTVHGQLESIAEGGTSGLSYLVSLTKGLPDIVNLRPYCEIVRTKSLERQTFALNRRFAKGILGGNLDIRQALDSLASEVLRLQDAAHADEKEEALTPGAIIERYPGGVNSFMDPTQRVKGFSTGYHTLDDLTGGFLGGQLIVLAGLQASGKTALALNIAANFIFRPEPIPTAILTYEMPPSSLLTRMISSRGRVSNYRIKHAYVNQEERRRMQEAAAELASVPLFISGQSRDIKFITHQIKNMATKGCEWEDAHGKKRVSKIRFVVIDRLEKITAESFNKNRSEADKIGHITGELQALALSLNIVIMLLCQVSRGQKQQAGKRHTCADLKGSSSIEQDADMVLFTFREWLWSRDRDDLKDKAEILIEKQKEGDIGICHLRFKGEFTLFLNPDEE